MENAATTTILVGIIVTLIKLVEYLVKKYLPKESPSDKPSLQPEQGRQLRELHESMIVVKRDITEIKTDSEKHLDTMKDIANCMNKVAQSQERTVRVLEKIDRRMEVEHAVLKRVP